MPQRVRFSKVDNRTIMNYESDGGGNSGIGGEAYIVGEYQLGKGSGARWHRFFGVYAVNVEPRSGTVMVSLVTPYGQRANAAKAEQVMFDTFNSVASTAHRNSWHAFRQKLGKVRTIREDDY